MNKANKQADAIMICCFLFAIVTVCVILAFLMAEGG